MPYSDPLLFLLAQKKELVFQLLRMANDTEFNEPNAENAEKFISFVDDREEIVDKLRELNVEINVLQKTREASAESAALDREIKEMTEQIARLELEISEKTLGIMEHLRKEIKDLNNRKKVSGVYEAN